MPLPESLTRAVLEHHGLVFRVAYSVVRNDADAEDVAQSTFLQLLRQRERLDEIESVPAWLGRVALNAARQFVRGESRRRERQRVVAATREERSEAMAVHGIDTDGLSDEEWAVRDAVARLPETLRLPLVLHYHEGLKYREIATVLECPEGTVARRISSGKQELEARLAPRFAPQVAGRPLGGLATVAWGLPETPTGMSERMLARLEGALATGSGAGDGLDAADGMESALASSSSMSPTVVVAGLCLMVALVAGVFWKWDDASDRDGASSRSAITANSGAGGSSDDAEADGTSESDSDVAESLESSGAASGLAAQDSSKAGDAQGEAGTTDVPPGLAERRAREAARRGSDRSVAGWVIHGRIVGGDGSALAAAEVTALDPESGHPIGSGVSTDEGEYEIELSRPPRTDASVSQRTPERSRATFTGRSFFRFPAVEVAVDHDGSASVATVIELARNSDSEPKRYRLDWTLPPSTAIEGRVIDAFGHPVAGASVEAVAAIVVGNPGLSDLFPVSRPLVTDERGEFRIDRARDAPWVLRVRGADSRDAFVRAVPGGEPLEIRLERGATLRVQVERRSGAPTSELTAQYEGSDGTLEQRVGADGTVEWSGLASGRGRVVLSRTRSGESDTELWSMPVELREGETTRRTASLEDGNSLRVSLSPSLLKESSRFELRLWKDGAESGPAPTLGARTAVVRRSEPEHRFEQLTPGEYTLAAYRPASKLGLAEKLAESTVSIDSVSRAGAADTSGTTRTVEVTLDGLASPLAQISLRIVDPNGILLDAVAQVDERGEDLGVLRAWARGDHLHGLASGHYRFAVQRPGCFPARTRSIFVRPGATTFVDIELTPTDAFTPDFDRVLGPDEPRLWIGADTSIRSALELLQEVTSNRVRPTRELEAATHLLARTTRYPSMLSVREVIGSLASFGIVPDPDRETIWLRPASSRD